MCTAQQLYLLVMVELWLGKRRTKFKISVIETEMTILFINRYRRSNVFNQTEIRAPHVPDVVSFTTDFSVTFGVLTSDDILFREPANALLQKNIRHFILPSAWTSELPFLTANQVQLAWAFSRNVTLLASGRNAPPIGNTGSGIYSGTAGALASVMSESSFLVQILTANVSVNPGIPREVEIQTNESNESNKGTNGVAKNMQLSLLRENLNDYGVAILDFGKNTTQSGRHCSGSLCCMFDIRVTDLGTVPNTVKTNINNFKILNAQLFDFVLGELQLRRCLFQWNT